MRILVVVPSYVPAFVYGGPIVSVAALCEALVRRGHQVRVLTTTANGTSELEPSNGTPSLLNGVEVIRYRRMTGDHTHLSPGLLFAFWRCLKQYDVVHIQSWWNLVAVPAALICLLRGVQPVISTRGSLTAYTFTHRRKGLKRAIHTFGGRWLLAQSQIHVTSARERQDLCEAVPGARVCVLPNIPDLPEPSAQVNPAHNELRILFLGRIDPIKRLDFLIRAVKGLPAHFWRLRIVGAGESLYMDSLKALAGKDSHISWHGPVYGDEKWRQYAWADLLVLPSYHENYGNVVIEALSQGTPVLLSDSIGLADWVTANRLGWIAGPDETAWRNSITRIFLHSDERARIRRLGPMCVRRDFDPGKLADAYIDLYTGSRRRSQ